MSKITEQNLAVFFQNFTNTLTNGTILYTTASLVPSNSIGNRVLALTVNGALKPTSSQNPYSMTLDFTNVKSEREITLEGPLEGQFNILSKTYSAKRIMSYQLKNRVLTLSIKLPYKLKKEREFYMNIQINDSGCSCSCLSNATYEGGKPIFTNTGDAYISACGKGGIGCCCNGTHGTCNNNKDGIVYKISNNIQAWCC